MSSTAGNIACLKSSMKRQEIPKGLASKLMELSEYDSIEFIIPGSPSCSSVGLRNTRRDDMIMNMLEIITKVPKCPKSQITFLGRPTSKIAFDQDEAYSQMVGAISTNAPSDTMSLQDYLEESLSTNANKSTVRYIFCDGTPEDSKAIMELLQNRANPRKNPVTFLNVSSSEDSRGNGAFMMGAKSLIPRCTQLEGFWEEAAKVHKNQGTALPYTQGLHLARCLVAAMNPCDLNSLDASVPLTKATFNMVVTKQQQTVSRYRTYFDGFLTAQKIRPIGETTMRVDRLKKFANWETLYGDFLVAETAHQIPGVQAYQRDLQQQELIQQNQRKIHPFMGVIIAPLTDIFYFKKTTRFHKAYHTKCGNEYLASELQ